MENNLEVTISAKSKTEISFRAEGLEEVVIDFGQDKPRNEEIKLKRFFDFLIKKLKDKISVNIKTVLIDFYGQKIEDIASLLKKDLDSDIREIKDRFWK